MAYIGAAQRLAKRCEAARWKVEEVRTGWKVYPPLNVPVIIHRTPKSRDYYKGLTRKFDELGLSKLEERYRNLKENERKERIEQDRLEVDALAKKAQRENLALLRAKYAGLSYTDDINWALTPSPHMQNPRIMEITPKMAGLMLERNTDNRPISQSGVRQIKRSAKEGRFLLTHDAIAFDTRGVLQDGQTRLTAIQESEATCPVWVYVGMPVENRAVINRQRRRNAQNALRDAGFEDAGPQHAAYARLVLAVQYGEIADRHKPRYDDDEIQRLWTADPDFHTDCFRRGQRIARTEARKASDGLFVTSSMAAAIHLIKKECDKKHWDYIDQWFDQIEGGYGVSDTDPRAYLRRYMLNNRKLKGFDNRGQLALIIDAWNDTLSNQHGTLHWRADRKFPRITRLG